MFFCKHPAAAERYVQVMASFRLSIRKAERSDIPAVIAWSGNQALTKHFHTQLPAGEQAGAQWFQRSLIDRGRNDFIIHALYEDGTKKPIGMVGLFNIDEHNRKAEYYILIGQPEFTRRGIAYRTTCEMLANCFETLGYNKVILSIDTDHIEAQRLAEKLGFRKEGMLTDDILLDNGSFADRYVYGMTAAQYAELKK